MSVSARDQTAFKVVSATLPWLVVGLLVVVVVGALQVRDRAPLAWDEAARVNEGRFLEFALRGADPGAVWQWLNRQTFYPFGLPALSGLALWITGNPITAAWLPSLLAYALAGILAGRLAAALGGGWAGAWSAALLTWLTPLEARLAGGGFAEPLGACALLLLLWLLVQLHRTPQTRLAVGAGLSVAAAWFIKYDYGCLALATFGLSAVVYVVTRRRLAAARVYVVAAASAAVPVGVWLLFDFSAKLRGIQDFIGQGSPGSSVHPDWTYYARALWTNGEVGLAPLVAALLTVGFIWAVVVAAGRPWFVAPVGFVVLWYALYSLTGNARYPRYMGPLLPVLAALAGAALVDWWRLLRPLASARAAVAGLAAIALVFAWQLGDQSRGASGLGAQFWFLHPDPPATRALAFAADALKDETHAVLFVGPTLQLSPYTLQVAWGDRLGRPAPFLHTVAEAPPAGRTQAFMSALQSSQAMRIVGLDVQPGSSFDTADFRSNFGSQPDYIRAASALDQQGVLRRLTSTSLEGDHLRVIVWDTPAGRAAQAAVTCTSARLKLSPAASRQPGTAVRLTAGSTGCDGTPQYRFSVAPSGGGWTMLRDYRAAGSFSWNTAGLTPGTYELAVTVRGAGSTLDRETVAYAAYVIGDTKIHCSALHAAAQPGSPQPADGVMILTARSSGCLGTPQYRFTVLPPNGNWTLVQDYGTGDTANWQTVGLAAGPYTVAVTVRSQKSPLDREQTQYIRVTLPAAPAAAVTSPAAVPAAAPSAAAAVVYGPPAVATVASATPEEPASAALSAALLPDLPVQTTMSGLKYQDVVAGSGDPLLAGQKVAVLYIASVNDGISVVSSFDTEQPYVFTLGSGDVVPGFDEAVSTMSVGGERRVVIPPELAYGAAGRSPYVPPNATLTLDIKVLSVR